MIFTKKKLKTRYCSHCGRIIEPILIGAETVKLNYGNTPTIPLGTAYDKITGNRQCVAVYTCKSWKKQYFTDNPHDNYTIEKIIITK